jgi:hypothetical protein
MATREMQLISRIVSTGDLKTVVDWGITEHDFRTNEGRTMFQSIVGYYARPESAGSVLGQNTIRQRFPSFVLCDDSSVTTAALCLEVRKQRLAIELDNLMDYVRGVNASDPISAITTINNKSLDLINIGIGKNTDMSLGDGISRQLHRFLQIESGVNLACGPWPWDLLNQVTGGIQPDDYIIIYGRPKSFKSWLLTFLIAFVVEQGKRAIVYTKEMSQDNIFNRIYACLARVGYSGLRLGKLSPEERNSLFVVQRFMEMSGYNDNVYCLSGRDAPEDGDTVPWLRSKAEKYQPDYIFIDGLYLMSDVKGAKKDNQRVANISRALSDLRLQLQIPVIATLQATREAAKHAEANLDEISFSDAIGQDATGAFRIIKDRDAKTCMMVLGGAREYSLNGFRINADPARDFSFNSTITAKDIENAKRRDGAPEDNPTAHVAKGPSPSATAKMVMSRMTKSLV